MEGDIPVLEFNHFKAGKDVIHAVFTRNGGTSIQPYDSLNIGRNCGDDDFSVLENRKRIRLKLGMKPLVFLNQVHGDQIQVLKKDDAGFISDSGTGTDSYQADGIITDIKGVFLVIQVADCQAVMLFDPVKKVVANVHSGWRGSIQNIVGKCVAKMGEVFGSSPGNILAGIGPSLGPCCAEFVNYRNEIPDAFWGYKQKSRDYFDFWAVSRDQLVSAGVKLENIENMNLCTRCNTDLFYSYRAQNTTGRFACVIAMA